MLTDSIRDFLARSRDSEEEEPEPFSRVDVAAAALMVETARIDGEFTDDERSSICEIVRRRLELDEETAETLVSVAEKRNDEVWHDFLFTEQIRSHASAEEQGRIIARLWEVAYADGSIHQFEAHCIERIGSELGISEESIAQHRETVRQQLGIEE